MVAWCFSRRRGTCSDREACNRSRDSESEWEIDRELIQDICAVELRRRAYTSWWRNISVQSVRRVGSVMMSREQDGVPFERLCYTMRRSGIQWFRSRSELLENRTVRIVKMEMKSCQIHTSRKIKSIPPLHFAPQKQARDRPIFLTGHTQPSSPQRQLRGSVRGKPKRRLQA